LKIWTYFFFTLLIQVSCCWNYCIPVWKQ